jgi:thiol-disulfide isomerase/thioredoxin
MYGVIIGIAVAIIAVLLLLAFVLPPIVSVGSPSVDKGTDINITAFLFAPGQKVAVVIVRVSDNQPIANYDYIANNIGILSFKLETTTFDAGEYKVVIKSGRREIAQSFDIRGDTKITTIVGPRGPIEIPRPAMVQPPVGPIGTTFTITAAALRPRYGVTVKIVGCNNDICTDNKTVLILGGPEQSVTTDSSGTLVLQVTSDNRWSEYNYVTVDDGMNVDSGYIHVRVPPPCSCAVMNGPASVYNCAPNFTLSALSGNSVTLCDKYNRGLSPMPVIWVNYWNSSCPGCNEYMRIIQHIKDTWSKGELQVFTINVGENPSIVSRYLVDRGFSFYGDSDYPVLFDTDKSVKERYHPSGDPCHYFIDQRGIIRVAKIGYGSIQTEEEVRAIVGEIIRRK